MSSLILIIQKYRCTEHIANPLSLMYFSLYFFSVPYSLKRASIFFSKDAYIYTNLRSFISIFPFLSFSFLSSISVKQFLYIYIYHYVYLYDFQYHTIFLPIFCHEFLFSYRFPFLFFFYLILSFFLISLHGPPLSIFSQISSFRIAFHVLECNFFSFFFFLLKASWE